MPGPSMRRELRNRLREFDAGNFKWEVRAYLDETDSEAKTYEIEFFKYMPGADADKELVWFERLHGELTHMFVETDSLYHAYLDHKIKFIRDCASKL